MQRAQEGEDEEEAVHEVEAEVSSKGLALISLQTFDTE